MIGCKGQEHPARVLVGENLLRWDYYLRAVSRGERSEGLMREGEGEGEGVSGRFAADVWAFGAAQAADGVPKHRRQ